jgi:hypothetical protein
LVAPAFQKPQQIMRDPMRADETMREGRDPHETTAGAVEGARWCRPSDESGASSYSSVEPRGSATQKSLIFECPKSTEASGLITRAR